jgi:putative endonuclease
MTKARVKSWFVYILRCADHTLYTGIAQDTARRLLEHNEDNRLAARYTRARRPVQLVYAESQPNRSAAAQREAAIKQLSKREKEALIAAK